MCGIEEQYLILRVGYFIHNRIKYPKCECTPINVWDDNHGYIGVNVCLDCGAVQGPKCPVCKNKLWTKDNKRFCKNYCGYRVN